MSQVGSEQAQQQPQQAQPKSVIEELVDKVAEETKKPREEVEEFIRAVLAEVGVEEGVVDRVGKLIDIINKAPVSDYAKAVVAADVLRRFVERVERGAEEGRLDLAPFIKLFMLREAMSSYDDPLKLMLIMSLADAFGYPEISKGIYNYVSLLSEYVGKGVVGRGSSKIAVGEPKAAANAANGQQAKPRSDRAVEGNS